jgi:hypothetical protein
MKRLVVILTLAFITCFAGTSQAGCWGRWGWRHRCWAPRPYVVVGECYHPVWIPGYWIWHGPYHRIWVRGYWR